MNAEHHWTSIAPGIEQELGQHLREIDAELELLKNRVRKLEEFAARQIE